MSKLDEIHDIGRHLDEQIGGRLQDAMELLMIAQHPPVVGCAIALASSQQLLQTAIAMWLTQLSPSRHDEMFEQTLDKIVHDVRRNKPKLLATIALKKVSHR